MGDLGGSGLEGDSLELLGLVGILGAVGETPTLIGAPPSQCSAREHQGFPGSSRFGLRGSPPCRPPKRLQALKLVF